MKPNMTRFPLLLITCKRVFLKEKSFYLITGAQQLCMHVLQEALTNQTCS